ncbi:hypothetical protein BDV06DRAFT_132122 [Aspergillus oleicola]
MLRRGHKKSRAGCVQCKKRHVKCDERRPRCVLCTMSNRECTYALESEARAPPADSGSASSTRASFCSSSPFPAQSLAGTLDDRVNLQHVELITHLITDSNLLSLGDGVEPYHITIALALRRGLESPYLLYELLAFAARHLAYLNRTSPERSSNYARQAINLQTQAIALFNAEKVIVDKSNCVAVCLFSVVLGHHLLTDTLSHREGGLDGFVSRYVQCLETHRGVFKIAMEGWELLTETELGPVLSRSRQFTSSEPKGTECDQLKNLVIGSANLNPSEKDACLRAIKHLQLGFDAFADLELRNMRYQMLFLWTILVPPEFTNMLAIKRPEALVVLAYYALLLCYGRHIWQVGDAGWYILELTKGYLGDGSGWNAWIQGVLPTVVGRGNSRCDFYGMEMRYYL